MFSKIIEEQHQAFNFNVNFSGKFTFTNVECENFSSTPSECGKFVSVSLHLQIYMNKCKQRYSFTKSIAGSSR